MFDYIPCLYYMILYDYLYCCLSPLNIYIYIYICGSISLILLKKKKVNNLETNYTHLDFNFNILVPIERSFRSSKVESKEHIFRSLMAEPIY